MPQYPGKLQFKSMICIIVGEQFWMKGNLYIILFSRLWFVQTIIAWIFAYIFNSTILSAAHCFLPISKFGKNGFSVLAGSVSCKSSTAQVRSGWNSCSLISQTRKLMSGKDQNYFGHWVDPSKRRNDAENLTLLNKSFDVIK